jgi:hypothetical protein
VLSWFRDGGKRRQVDELVDLIHNSAEQGVVESFRCPWCGANVLLGAHPTKKHLVTVECRSTGSHFARTIELKQPRPDWWEKFVGTSVWYERSGQ